MKVLICNRPGGAFGYITDGFYNALRDKGHTVRRWDGIESSWRSFDPDVYIGCSGHKQPIPPNRRNCKVAIHVNPYGPVNIPGINENTDNIRWTLNQKPDAVFGYGGEHDRLLWSYWTTKHNIPWVPMPCAGDKVIFKQSSESRQYDVVYLGGRWAYKAKTIDAYLLPALTELSKRNFKSSVRGWGDWPDGVCGGPLPEDQANEFLNSGRVAPCISEAHTHSHGIDVPERVFKTALCGALPVHDAVPSLTSLLPSVVVAQTPQNFVDLCVHYAGNENERLAKLLEIQREVLSNHTYHHRMSALLSVLGFAQDAENMVK